MRQASVGLSICVCYLAALCGGAAAAEPERSAFPALSAILPAQTGNKACYVRTYDAAHLKAHPRQHITAMKFLLAVETYPEPSKKEQPEDLYYYPFAMQVMRRGESRPLHTAGDCLTVGGIHCVVDCDGGAVNLDEMPPADSLIVRISEYGVRMFHDCDDGEGILVMPGADDKVFRLDKAALDACRALGPKEK